MQPQLISGLGGLFMLVYLACVIGTTIFLLRLLWRFVTAHEKMATSLEAIARKFKEEQET